MFHYVKKLTIDQFRVLEDFDIQFCFPNNPDNRCKQNEHGNVVNVIAGVNGVGKTSLLEFIFQGIAKSKSTFLGSESKIQFSNDTEISTHALKFYTKKIEYHNHWNNEGDERKRHLIFSSSQQKFEYQFESQLIASSEYIQRINNDNILGNAEAYIKEFVISQERQSNKPDPASRTQTAVNAFNQHFLDAKMLTKLVNLSHTQFNRPVFQNASNQEVTIDQLSDGEKQLYGRVIALMILEPQNSIILIDEPEIALHPAWQQKIMSIYSRIGKNNQFIVATHSPQVLASVPYQNRIILHKREGKIQPLYYHSPPSGVDVNSILSEVMGADPQPPSLLNLYHQYRQLVEQRQENSEQAKQIKQQLLEEENEHSEFMQEMQFLIELRDV